MIISTKGIFNGKGYNAFDFLGRQKFCYLIFAVSSYITLLSLVGDSIQVVVINSTFAKYVLN